MLPLLLALLPALTQPALAQDDSPDPDAGDTGLEEPLPLLKLPELTEFSQAPYPPGAEEAGVEGNVLLLLEIDEVGAVMTVEVLESPDNAFSADFDAAAMEAAKGFLFSPAEDETGPVPVAIEFVFGFELEEEAIPVEELAPEDLPVTLEGLVVEMGTSQELAEMAVIIPGEDPAVPLFETATDEAGAFSLRGVPPGTWTLKVMRPGWEIREFEVEVLEGEVTQAKIWVKNLDYGANEAVGLYRRETEEITRRTISMSEVRRVPGTFGDPIRVIQSLPGAARSPFGTGVLIIRGANPEDSGVYIEGIRIPLIYHLGGYSSVFNPELIESVDYLPGGYGVQYGRTMGGAIDVKLKEEAPEKKRISWSTDLLDSGGLYEGRHGEDDQHHVGVAARRSYVDLVLAQVNRNSGFTASPRWFDYQLRYHYDNDQPTKFTAFMFGFRDQLLVSTPDSFAQGTDSDFQGDIGVDYGTHRGLVKIERPAGDFTLKLIPSFGVDYTYTGFGDTLSLELTQYTIEIRAEAPWEPNEHLTLTPGVDFIGGWANYAFELPFNPDDVIDFDPIGERSEFDINGSQSGWGPDFYAKASIRPLADPDALLLLPGIRLNYVNIPNQYAIVAPDPRITFRAKLTDGVFIKGGTGLYHQPPQPFESYRPDGLGVDLGFEQAWASALGWEQQIIPGLNAELVGFYKALNGQIITNPDIATATDQFYVNDGLGRIYGLEFILRRDPVGKFFGWLSYTLSRSERNDDPDGDPNPFGDPEGWYAYDFDQTHIATAVGSYRLPWELEFGGRFQYVTGNPYTPFAGGVYDVDQDSYFAFQSGDRNSERLPPFSSLDLRLSKRWIFNKGWFELYVDALNVYRGENPEFTLDNYDYTESRYIRGLPFIPSPGFSLEWNF